MESMSETQLLGREEFKEQGDVSLGEAMGGLVDLSGWMQEVGGIVRRFKLRGNALPRFLDGGEADERRRQEHNDASNLLAWKNVVNDKTICPQEILIYLDAEIPQWRNIQPDGDSHEFRVREAQAIVHRYKSRGGLLPVRSHTYKPSTITSEIAQEDKDAENLFKWKLEVTKQRSTERENNENTIREYMALCDYLDVELPGWRDDNFHTNNDSAATNSAMEIARGIYNRYLDRSCQMPQHYGHTGGDPEKEQEARDAMKLNEWKLSLLSGLNRKPDECPEEVSNFLDEHMSAWREKSEKQQASNQKAMIHAVGIVERYQRRGNVMPVRSKECKSDPTRAQEYRDAAKLNDWKQSLKGNKTKGVCCEEVKSYLDEKMPQWREVTKETHNDPMTKAEQIVQRYRERGNVMPREWREHRHDPVRAEEYKDASKLRNWKRALKGNGTHNCPDAVRDYLDQEMPDWRKDVRKQYCNPMVTAQEIVERYNLRNKVLPRHFSSNRKDPERQQEYKDAKKLYDWKQGLKGLRFYRCSPELKEYLDANLPGWNDGVYSKASLLAEAEKAKENSNMHGMMDGTGSSSTNMMDKNTVLDDDDSKVVSVSLPGVSLGISDPNAEVVGEVMSAGKRLREDDDGLDIQTQHHQQHQHQQHVVVGSHEQGNELVSEEALRHHHDMHQQHNHMLLPPQKIPRVMETKEV